MLVNLDRIDKVVATLVSVFFLGFLESIVNIKKSVLKNLRETE